MGFGIDLDVKVEVPAVPSVSDVAKTVGQVVSAATDAVAAAVPAAKEAATNLADAATGLATTVGGAVGSLAGAAGLLAEPEVSFTGDIADIPMEPHTVLEANADEEETQFEKGPVWIRLQMTPEQARQCTDTLHLFCETGDYDEEKAIADFDDEGEDTVDIQFTDAIMHKSARYTLEIVTEDGDAYLVFEHATYGKLRKDEKL